MPFGLLHADAKDAGGAILQIQAVHTAKAQEVMVVVGAGQQLVSGKRIHTGESQRFEELSKQVESAADGREILSSMAEEAGQELSQLPSVEAFGKERRADVETVRQNAEASIDEELRLIEKKEKKMLGEKEN